MYYNIILPEWVGTLTEPVISSTQSVQYALHKMRIVETDDELMVLVSKC